MFEDQWEKKTKGYGILRELKFLILDGKMQWSKYKMVKGRRLDKSLHGFPDSFYQVNEARKKKKRAKNEKIQWNLLPRKLYGRAEWK